MNAPRATPDDYIAFLVTAHGEGIATVMARCQPIAPDASAHDAFTRLLNRVEPDTEVSWHEVRQFLPAKGWYSGLENLNLVRSQLWTFLTPGRCQGRRHGIPDHQRPDNGRGHAAGAGRAGVGDR